MGETVDGAKVFNSQIIGVQQGNPPPSLRRSLHLPQPGAQALPAALRGSRRGADTLTELCSELGASKRCFLGKLNQVWS